MPRSRHRARDRSSTCCSARRRLCPGAPKTACSSSTRCGSTCRDSATSTNSATRRAGGGAARRGPIACSVEPDPTCEAPLDGSRLPEAPLPTPDEYDLRTARPRALRTRSAREAAQRAWPTRQPRRRAAATTGPWPAAAQRGWRRLVANDMHLGLRVPNIWYRARLVVAGDGLDVTGVTPARRAARSSPAATAASPGDSPTATAISRTSSPRAGTGNPVIYLTADGPRAFEVDDETLEVAGGEPETLIVRRTIWGPVIGDDGAGHELALAWTAHRDGRDRHGAARARARERHRRGRRDHRRRRHARRRTS